MTHFFFVSEEGIKNPELNNQLQQPGFSRSTSSRHQWVL